MELQVIKPIISVEQPNDEQAADNQNHEVMDERKTHK